MPRVSRGEVIDPNEINIVHAFNRTVRRCFLLGDDEISGKNYDHRKVWIEEIIEHFAAQFAIDLLCYSILSNHYHLILRTRPDVVASWDDSEVARRWLMICPKRRRGGKPVKPSEAELNSIRDCPDKLTEIRTRLSNVSWWMRLLNQRVAQRANREDEQEGRFWQDRFKAIRLIDEESVLACAAYVELNPIRAAMAETLESSKHTSIARRIESEVQQAILRRTPEQRRDAFLAKLTIDKTRDIGVVPSKTGKRCSDKGFFEISTEDYFELLDWTARQVAPGKRGSTPETVPPILTRLGLKTSAWTELVCNFDQTFYLIAGRVDRVSQLRTHVTHRRFNLTRRAKTLLAVAA